MPTISYPGTPGTPIYAGRPAPVVGDVLITSFPLENWDAVNASRTLFRGGMPFEKGDIPAGSVPEIRRAGGAPVAAQFDERTTWSDGSLRYAVCHLRDTVLAAATGQDYEVYSVTGSYDNTGTVSLATVATDNALTVEISSFAQWNGTSSATRGSGAALASFAAHAAVATRVTKVHSGPVCEGWEVWGMAKDGADGSGSEDAHLKVIWHVDVWKDAGGTVIDTEHCAELAQNWWGVANKFRLDYTATYKRNGTTVETYTGLQHPYRAHWATVRKQADHNNSKRHWVGDVPTLLYKPEKAYWVRTGVIPPLDPDFVPNGNVARTYVPLSNLGHRPQIDGTGAYEGRGMITNIDAKAFMLQTAVEFQRMRTNAFAGLHYVGHFRDERERTRSGEDPDIANTVIPMLWDPKPEADSTFTGLPAPKHAYADYRATVTYDGGYIEPAGGNGVWTASPDQSHAPAFSTFAYIHEGERYMLNSVIDMATKTIHQNIGNEFGGRPRLHWYNSAYARAEMSIPASQWAAISDYHGQERNIGWSAMLLGYAAALVPDSDLQSGYLRGVNEHNADYMAACVDYMPPSLKAAGWLALYGAPAAPEVKSPWMSSIAIQGLLQNFRCTEASGHREFAAMAMNMLVPMLQRAPYDLGAYRTYAAPKRGTYSASNIWYDGADYLLRTSGGISANRLTITGTSDSLRYNIQDDDEIKFHGSGSQFTVTPVPPEYPEETIFYAVNSSGLSCDLALTPGGTPVALSNGTYSIGGRFFGGTSLTPAAESAYSIDLSSMSDSYLTISEATFAYGESVGLETLPAGSFAAMEAFLINVDRENWPAWKLLPPA